MPVIEISSLSHPGVEMFCTLTEAQLRNRIERGCRSARIGYRP